MSEKQWNASKNAKRKAKNAKPKLKT